MAGLIAAPVAAKGAWLATDNPDRIYYDWAMISSDDNRPRLAIDDTYNLILAKLHLGSSPAEFAGQLQLSPADLQHRLDALVAEGLAVRDGSGRYRPAVPVITARDVRTSLRVDPAIVRTTADAIARELPRLKRDYAALPGFGNVPFGRASLLILSDVLLDNWQIDRVESNFIHAARPQRAGGRYYFSVRERRKGDPVEAFGVYGNHGQSFGNIGVNLYGNERYSGPPNLVTISGPALIDSFGFAPGTGQNAARSELAQDLVQLWRDATIQMPSQRIAGLRSLGLLDGRGRTAIPVLSQTDQSGLDHMAADFAPELLGILGKYRRRLEAQYRSSVYADEGVSLPEFTIWWYHLFYTAVTNELARRGLIQMPPNGTVSYLTIG
jgi:hypothetical protein